MCGIAGCVSKELAPDLLMPVVRAMTDSIKYRGPDDEGHWINPDFGVALGHRRLSILDLSPLGHQPMVSQSGRYTITYNGEVYNYMDIRRDLEKDGVQFRGTSDTEVMLEAFEQFGIDKAVSRFNGMFAFAVWDSVAKELSLVRDRFGVKPLFYHVSPWGVAFASELKAFASIPHFSRRVNKEALRLFMQFCYVPAPYSILDGIWKLTPGSIVTIPTKNFRSAASSQFSPYPETSVVSPRRYWSAWNKALEGITNPRNVDESQVVEELDVLLRDAVRLRMISDVPVGAFLSGGIDSSLVVALMQEQSSSSVRSFSIGFNEDGYNEAVFAKKIANHLGTDHTELYVTSEVARSMIPKLAFMYDEPFGDSSQIPTSLVSELARQRVTVSLSGDGGDEFFGGYQRYMWGDRLWRIMKWLPRNIRSLAGKSLQKIPVQSWDTFFHTFGSMIPAKLQAARMGEKLHRFAAFLNSKNRSDLYVNLQSFWSSSDDLVPSAQSVRTDHLQEDSRFNFFELMMIIDAVTYLSDDILTKVDRATMAVSLEGREPLLDYRLFEFAWSMPLSMKYAEGKGKKILRTVLSKYVPLSLFDRPKMGFGIPLGSWLRGPLRKWADELLDPDDIRSQGYLNAELIHRQWRKHLSGERDLSASLWNVLMFQSWLQKGYLEGDSLGNGERSTQRAVG